MKFRKYIHQAFPLQENKWPVIILISLFVSLFLIVFQPFGINLMPEENRIILLSGYGLVTFVVLFLDLIVIERLFPKTFNEKSWTISKEFLWLIWVIFSIGLGNSLYTFYLFEGLKFSFQLLFSFQLTTFLVGIIPISLLIISKQNYLLKKHVNSAELVNTKIETSKTNLETNQIINFYAENDKDFIPLNTNELLFIESAGNYIDIYMQDENKIIRKTFRSTLKRFLDFTENTNGIIQCHRAYIINSKKILSAKGNSQGLKLNLENCEQEIPVSRGFVNSVREIIKNS